MSKRSGNITKTIEVERKLEARELLNLNLMTIERELKKIEAISKASAELPLVAEFGMALVQYAKTLVQVDKNYKENPDENDDDDLKNLSDQELAELAKQILLGKQNK